MKKLSRILVPVLGVILGMALAISPVAAAQGKEIVAQCSLMAGVSGAAQRDRIDTGDSRDLMLSTITAAGEEAVARLTAIPNQHAKIFQVVTAVERLKTAVRWVFATYNVSETPSEVYQDTMTKCLKDSKIEKILPAPEGEVDPELAVEYLI